MLDRLKTRVALKLLSRVNSEIPTDHIEVVPWMNKYSTYPSVNITPERITAIFKQADLGYTREQTDFFEEMLEKDLYLFGLVNQRIQSIARRQFQIVPANESSEAKKRMEFAKDVVDEIKGFRQCIKDTFSAIGYGVTYQQINWKLDGNGAYIESFEWTHGRNFRWGKASDPNDNLRIPRRYTYGNLIDGVELEQYKWLVSVMRARSGHPARAALLRTCAWLWFFKNIDFKSWVIFCELYGIPVRIGKYKVNASEEDKAVIRRAVQQLGVDASAVISELTDIEFKETSQKSAASDVFDKLKDTCNKEYAVGVLGHESASSGTPGKLGKEDMAEDVRFDLVESDAEMGNGTIKEQILDPICDLNFGPDPQNNPHWTFTVEPERNRKEEADIVDSARNRIRIPLVTAEVYNRLGYSQPEPGDEDVLLPASAPPQSMPGKPSTFKAISPVERILFGSARSPLVGQIDRYDRFVCGGPGSGDFGHEERPGEIGGSGEGGGIPKTRTYEDVHSPEKTASDYAQNYSPPEITNGTKKQIKYSTDLRNNFVANLKDRNETALRRWAKLHPDEESHQTILAQDAVDRATLRIVHSDDAKTILDRFVSPKFQIAMHDARIRYLKMLQFHISWDEAGKR